MVGAAAALAAGAAVTLAQVPVATPRPIGGVQQELPIVSVEDMYGPLQVEELATLAQGGRSYNRRLVLTRGRVADLVPNQYLMLQDGAAQVMLIPMNPGDYQDYIKMLGMDVDLTGVLRVLPAKQSMERCHGGSYPESKCLDWDLPVLPDRQIQWPEVSITMTRIVDHGSNGVRRPTGTRTLADTGVDAAATDGKPVRALGLFRGANLCKDLPETSRRDPADWVLHTSEGPVWVTGRAPAGKGFRLDPAYRGDTTRWLEVSGKVLIVDNVRYLKASKVSMIPRPPEAEPVSCPP